MLILTISSRILFSEPRKLAIFERELFIKCDRMVQKGKEGEKYASDK